jgi:capsular polysaccharide transport system permease protein
MTQSIGLLWRDLTVQCRVVGAIMLRDMVTRWGRRNLGFAWLFCEPLIFAFPVIMVWSYVRAPFEHGLPMTTFVWTGYMPLLIFRHVTSGALFSLRGSTALFYHRRVTPLDVFFGRQGLEALGNLASVAVSLVLFVCIGVMNFPEDYGLMLLGFLYTTWWSLCIALILAGLSERSEIVAHVWAPISYLYIFFSGFFFLVQWLPPSLQRIVLATDPPVHCYEMIRSGMFGGQLVYPYYDIGYVSFILAILTLIGLWLMHDVRNHLELQ